MRTAAVLTVLALAWCAVLIQPLWWIWGVAFAAWALRGMAAGETFLIGRHGRADEPLLFWSVSLSWLAMGILWVLYPGS